MSDNTTRNAEGKKSAAAINKRQRVFWRLKKEEEKLFGASPAPDARRMAPCGMSSSLPLPEGFLLLVVR